jgi:arsenate reductase
MMKVLILCTANSCRSQMAHGWFNHLGKGSVEACSAGIRADGVNELAARVMSEAGVDISHHTSNPVDEYLGQDFDLVITVCAGADAQCPTFIGKVGKRLHWPFDDPAAATGTEAEVLDEFRRIRDQIRDRVDSYLTEKNA